MIEVAVTVFVYGAVAAGALLTLVTAAYLDARIKLIQAQTLNERRLHGNG